MVDPRAVQPPITIAMNGSNSILVEFELGNNLNLSIVYDIYEAQIKTLHFASCKINFNSSNKTKAAGIKPVQFMLCQYR